jgi:hypothetical protein
MKDEALRLALGALKSLRAYPETMEYFKQQEAITAIKQALEETQGVSPESEPVAYGMWDTMIGCGGRMMMVRLDKGQDGCTVPLYTFPPKREPLTDEMNSQATLAYPNDKSRLMAFIDGWFSAEQAHGIKENT